MEGAQPDREYIKRENISVAIRCRPATNNQDAGPERKSTAKTNSSSPSVWNVCVADRRVALEAGVNIKNAAYLQTVQREGKKLQLQDFQFDMVFDEQASTRQVYQNAAQGLVLSALDGINATVMAYGQTGAVSLNTFMAYGQTGAVALRTVMAYGQTGAVSLMTVMAYGQIGAFSLRTVTAYGQTGVVSLRTVMAYGQTGLVSLRTVMAYGQVGVVSLNKVVAYGQTVLLRVEGVERVCRF